LCASSNFAGVALVRQAKAGWFEGSVLININSLHLTDADISYFDSRARLNPPLRRQQRPSMRCPLAADTIDAPLVSDHT
jgi:dihydroorotase